MQTYINDDERVIGCTSTRRFEVQKGVLINGTICFVDINEYWEVIGTGYKGLRVPVDTTGWVNK